MDFLNLPRAVLIRMLQEQQTTNTKAGSAMSSLYLIVTKALQGFPWVNLSKLI